MLWFPKCMCFGKSGKSDSCYSSAEQTTVNGRPSSQTSNNNVASKPRKKLFLGLKRKPPPNTNPPLPQKPQHFNPENIPNIDDPIPTYESVDVADSDVAYSRVHERPRRYEYPTFNRTRASEEAVYASASQIYSGGSEDPYSSIVSDIEGKKADDTSVGYARVQDDLTQPSTSRAVRNVESLYAKINRNSINRKMSENNPRRPEVLSTEIRAPVPSTSASVPQPMEHTASVQTHTVEPLFEPVYQYEGSITSTESRNPSYKYLTVRETLGAIRERIRAREEGLQQNPPSREHYYSTIQNDYETVKDVRAPLSVITDSNSNPRPPTSPVPSHVPPMVRSLPLFDKTWAPIYTAHSYTSRPRPIVISLASLSRVGGSAPDITRSKKKSQIPVPKHRRPLPQKQTKSQPQRNLKPLFSPQGHDYVSLIDLGREKGWPFTPT